MSTDAEQPSELIQHIDDACEIEYTEGFAPKAQEEILSETQDSNKNITEEIPEHSESNDMSNEEINEASNEEVIKDVESEQTHQEEEDTKPHEEEIEIIADNSQDSEINPETIDAEEADVVMTEPEALIDSEETEEQIIDEDEVEVTHEEPVEAIASEDPQENEPEVEEAPETEEVTTASEDHQTDEVSEIIEEQSTEQNEAITTVEDDHQIEETPVETTEEITATEEAEEAHKTEDNEEITEEQTDDQQSENVEQHISEADNGHVELKSENEIPTNSDEVKTIINSVPVKGKDVKSLSTSYGQEDNLTNGNCCMCNKIVYPMEKLVTNDRLFHKVCFRCTKCKNALSAGNFTFNQGRPYCTPHYVELFKKRGRYDENDVSNETENSTTADASEPTDELPAPDTTKNILAKFRDLETGGCTNANQSAAVDSADDLPAPNTTKNLMERFSALGQEKSEAKCKPKIDIPRHSNGHSHGSSENEPIVLSKDVVRSNEPGQDDKPEHGITKNLVNQFRKMESSANN